jgi:manganese efflux pump family protein
MTFLTIIVIALALAMDAFAVSIITGSTSRKLHIKHALRMALSFGLFQAVMPLLGALAGLKIKNYVANYDHWVAFALLAAVGIKMVYESFKIKTAEEKLDPSNIYILLILSVATSIDAFAVGITISFLDISLALAVSIIGAVTFVLSYLGTVIGKKFGHFFESKIEAIGGLILIGLGLKILLQHLLA